MAHVNRNHQLVWLAKRDVLTREQMVEYMRRQWPASEALRQALADTAVSWQHALTDLPAGGRADREDEPTSNVRQRSDQASYDRDASPSTNPRPTKKRKGGGKGKDKGKGGKGNKGGGGRSSIVTTLRGGVQICGAYNLGKCDNEKKCPHQAKHICNKALRGGQACAGKHPRAAPGTKNCQRE